MLHCALAAAVLGGEGTPSMPMPLPAEHTAAQRWLAKKVLASRLLDDAESIEPWKMSFWAQGKGDIALTAERARNGTHSLRFRSATRGEKPSPDGGVFGSTAAVRAVPDEDWTDFNRLSFWVYPHMPGFHAISLMVRLRNRGTQLARDTHHVLLDNDRWSHVVWEFPDLARDRVSELAFTYVMNGSERGATETAQFDIDQIELQRVEADPYEGWGVAPGRIAFCHTGYAPGARKVAIASGLDAGTFQVVHAEGGQAALAKPVQTVETKTGRFQVLDFTDLAEPGTYRIRAGTLGTLPFRIGGRVWDRTIWKAINFFYVERCGTAIPGVHALCHADWQGEHGGKRIPINGGWHDAGDLSQGLVNTSEAAWAMFALAERLRERGDAPALAARLLEEAKWGLDWVLKTSFHDGHRIQWAVMRFWTNGILGDRDDVVAKAQAQPAGSFYAAAAEAIAARVLRADDPDLAKRALAMAREDWQHGADRLPEKRDGIHIELASIGALASIELFKATGESRCADLAADLARAIAACQQRPFLPGLEAPITGMFHRTPRRRGFQTYLHRSHEQCPIVALAELCRTFPDHPDWMAWYATVAIHSRYSQQAMAALTAPYHMLPNSLRHIDEHKRVGKQHQEAVREQIANGFPVGGGYHVRVYPVQASHQFRGNYGTILSQAMAVSAAAHLRTDAALAALARDQLEWVVGRNPFGQSTMYGEGYDCAPQYTARSGDIVGSLPVGMKSLGNADLPYWPATNVWNYKEVWVHPVSRWLGLMRDLAGPPRVEGTVGRGIEEVLFTETRTRRRTSIPARRGSFQATLPEGVYDVACGPAATRVTLLPNATVRLDLRPERVLDLRLAGRAAADGRVTLTLTARGSGRHTFALRAHNLAIADATMAADLAPGKAHTLTWEARLADPTAPWVAVVLPDGHLDRRVEAIGSAKD